MRFALAAASLLVLALSEAADAQAQTQAPTRAQSTESAFEVASVKPNVGARGLSLRLQPGGRFTATNITLHELIGFAYQVQPFQIVGESDVLDDRFDVIAKAGNDIPAIQPGIVGPVNAMVQALLGERFRLRLHREQPEMSVYALVLAGKDGMLGSEIESRTEQCALGLGRPAAPPEGKSARPGWPAARGEAIPCGITMMGTGRIATGGLAMSQFVRTLANVVGDAVIDKTGMSGVFAFQLDYAPATIAPINGNELPDPVDRPSVFTALQEQLGLKLERIRAPVEVLVIDSVEQPTPD